MHLFTCWTKHGSASPLAEMMVVLIARVVFKCLDMSALPVKQVFAAKVMRLQAESSDKTLQCVLSNVLLECPEIRQL